MDVYRTIIGNIADPLWQERLQKCDIDNVLLDQWNAQKSRLLAIGESGRPYAIALERGVRLRDGDIIAYNTSSRSMVVVRLRLSEVMIVDLSSLFRRSPTEAIATAIELGHAIGNQHWPAVVRGAQVFVPMSIDRKVMESVMKSHPIEGLEYEFRPGSEIIPYLSPHELRLLFGGSTEQCYHNHNHSHNEHHHTHSHHKVHAHGED